jgi:hypothetical protein
MAGQGQQKQDTRSDESSYEAKYPYNHVWESWGGHQIQWDDTPGKERFFMRHSSGTYQEISSDGKNVSFTVGDSKSYNKGGVTFTVDENNDVKMTGHSRMVVGGGAHIEVAGDAGIMVGGDTAMVGMGKVNMRAKSMYMGVDGGMSMNVGGNMTMKVKGNTNMETKGTHTMKGQQIQMNPSSITSPGGGSDVPTS